MARYRWIGVAITVALATAGCKGDRGSSGQDRRAAEEVGGTLVASAGKVLEELLAVETRKDVTCWTSFRQLDWFIAEKSYSEFGTLAKIVAVKGMVRAAWARAAAAAKGPQVTAADLAAAVSLPAVELPAQQQKDLVGFANDVGLENYTNYQKTAEHWRVVLAVLQDEILAGGEGRLKPLDAEALRALADTATTLSLLLLKKAAAEATADRSDTIEGPHVQRAYKALLAEHDLENPPRTGKPLGPDEVARTLQPLTRRLIDNKIKALNVFNKTTGNITSDLNKVTRIPLTEEATDHLMKQVQSFNHFVTSGIDPMRADNYLSDGSYAVTRFVRKPYLDDVHVQNAVMQLFPHHMMANGDILVRYEPNPGPVTDRKREPFEVKLLDHEQNGVRDSAMHWIAMQKVFGEKPFAMDPFAAEYLSEVNSMMMTLFIRRGEEIARQMGKTEIDLEVARRVQDRSMVLVPPHAPEAAGWTEERQARKAKVMAALGGGPFRDASRRSGLPVRLAQFEGRGLEIVDGHVEPDTKKLQGHAGPPDTKKLEGHAGPPDTKKLTGHTEPDLQQIQGHFNLQRIMGGGIAVGDLNGDGYPDLFLTGEGLGRLYLNRGKAGPGRFVDASKKWGVPHPLEDGHGTLFLDLEGDGDLDLVVLRSENPSLLLRNDGGRFTDVAGELGFAPHRGAHVLTALDHDADGDLDLYVGYYGNHEANIGKSDQRNLPSLDGKNGSPNQMWQQGPDGRFTEVGQQIGVADPGWALAIGTADFDGDGDPDIHIANDFGANTFYQNQGDGTFRDVTELTDTGDRGSGMNVDFGDPTGDGRWDFYITNIDMFSKRIKVVFPRDESTINVDESLVRAMQYLSGNKLYVATGDPARPYRDEEGARMEPGDRGWGWDAGFFDLENDGDDDLYMCNGWVDGSYAGNQRNQMFVNDDGFLYQAPPTWAEAFPGNSRSAVQVDLDLDGDVDLVVNNFRQPPRVLENAQKSGQRWIRLRLAGQGKNTRAIGAEVRIEAGGRTILRQQVTGRGYLAQADPAIHAGLGGAAKVDVTVRWPDGRRTEHPGLAAGREHRLAQPAP